MRLIRAVQEQTVSESTLLIKVSHADLELMQTFLNGFGAKNSPENLDKLLVAIVVQIFEFKTYFTDPIKLMHFGALLAYKGPTYSEFILKYLSLLTLLESPSRPELPLSIIFIFLKKVRKAEPE